MKLADTPLQKKLNIVHDFGFLQGKEQSSCGQQLREVCELESIYSFVLGRHEGKQLGWGPRALTVAPGPQRLSVYR